MTIRTATLERLDSDLLLARVRRAPDDDGARTELSRRGLAHRVQEVIVAEAEDRFLERLPNAALAARAYALDREIGDLGTGGLA